MEDSDNDKRLDVDVSRSATGGELPLGAQPAATSSPGLRNIMRPRGPEPAGSADTLGHTFGGDELSSEGEQRSHTSTAGDGDRKPPEGGSVLAGSSENPSGPGPRSNRTSEGSSDELKKPVVDPQELIRAYEARRRGSDARREILALEGTIKAALAAGVPLGPLHRLLEERRLVSIKKTRFVDLCTEMFELPR